MLTKSPVDEMWRGWLVECSGQGRWHLSSTEFPRGNGPHRSVFASLKAVLVKYAEAE